jgi:hypothetical protein
MAIDRARVQATDAENGHLEQQRETHDATTKIAAASNDRGYRLFTPGPDYERGSAD